jgi:spore germination protein YaaH
MLTGIVIGAVLMASSSVFADQIKSLVGKTVAGEYTVSVDGKTLSEKAIVVDSKAHVPLRAVSDSLGATIKVDGKTVSIVTDTLQNTEPQSSASAKSYNPYVGMSKEELENSKKSLIDTVITPANKHKTLLEERLSNSEAAKARGEDAVKSAQDNNLSEAEKRDAETLRKLSTTSYERTKKELESLISDIEKYDKQLNQVEEALKALGN